jgi:hypothetical protein
MREYGQIQCSFWTDPDVQTLSDSAARLAAYLLTGPHSNGLGCYRLPDGYIMADFGWDQETVSKGFAELFRIGFCKRCERTGFVLIPNFLRWNPIANANVASAREKEFDAVHKKTAVYQELCRALLTHGKHLSDGFRNRLETLSKGYGKQDPTQPYPEQDPEQDPEQESVDSACAPDATPGEPSDPSPPPAAAHQPTAEGEMAAALRKQAVDVGSMHPTLIAWVKDGYTTSQLLEAVELARVKKPYPERIPANYLDAILRQPGKPPAKRGGTPRMPKNGSLQGIDYHHGVNPDGSF